MATAEANGKTELPESVQRVPATDAPKLLPELVSQAQYAGIRSVIMKHGDAAAAIVSIADLERLVNPAA